MHVFADLLTHFVFMKQELDRRLLSFPWVPFSFFNFWPRDVFSFVIKDSGFYQPPRSETKTEGFQSVMGGGEGRFQLELMVSVSLSISPTFHILLPFPSTPETTVLQRRYNQCPQLLKANSLLNIPLAIYTCILLSFPSSYLNVGCKKLSAFCPQLWAVL